MPTSALDHIKRPIRDALGNLGARRFLYPRRFHAYCCGTGKTGTHSIQAIFSNYRSVHEVDLERTIYLATAYLDKKLSDDEIMRLLKKRDRILWHEMDSSLVNGAIVKPLAKAFPEAKFILTIRDVLSWADSTFNHQINKSVPELWQKLDHSVMKLDNFAPTKWDAPLTERGLYPLAAYFRNWATHNSGVLENVPNDRLLIVKTKEIRNRISEMAAFVRVPADTLDPGLAWSYTASDKHDVLAQIDQSYVREMAEKYCSDLMKRFFPDIPPYGQS